MTESEVVQGRGLEGYIGTVPGFAYGCRYPGILITIAGKSMDSEQILTAWRELLKTCPTMAAQPLQEDFFATQATPDWQRTVLWMLYVWQCMQASAGLPVYEVGRLLAVADGQARCIVPCQGDATEAVFKSITSFLAWLDAYLRQDESSQKKGGLLAQAVNGMARFSPGASNVPRLVNAAFEMSLPFRVVQGAIYQFGVGARARWLDSSFTDETSVIGTKVARNKVWAAKLLKQAGLPVPAHQLAANADTAVKIAGKLGYPVVVKPADLDGGLAVAAGLVSESEVRAAFATASENSRKILVEKHVNGRDYRLTVMDDEVIWAIERVPGGVTGDGVSCVAGLLAQLNADPRRGSGAHAPLKKLLMDAEAEALLARASLTLESVPEEGVFVPLRRAANVASGGMPVAVFQKVHPDNKRLAVYAAQTLHLDLAGVDLLIPDISVSWRESGAAICEVNGQPNLGQTTAAHLYQPILRKLVPCTGRIPTILVLGAAPESAWSPTLAGALSAAGYRVGYSDERGVGIADDVISPKQHTPFDGGQMLVISRQVEAMIIAINGDSILKSGLPIERYDALILAGAYLRLPREDDYEKRRLLEELLACILPACDGVVFGVSESGLSVRPGANNNTAEWVQLDGDLGSMVAVVVERVEQCVRERDARFNNEYLATSQ